MKKFLLTLLVFICTVCVETIADNVTKRIYVITDANFQTYQGTNGLAIHAWYTDDSGDVLGSQGNENEKMATFDGFNPSGAACVWFKDITFDSSKTIKFFVYKKDDSGWHSSDSSQQEVSSNTNSYYSWDSNNNGDLSVAGTIKYYAYKYDGSSWSSEELTTEDYNTYTKTIDNQTSFNSNLEVIIASSIGLNHNFVVGEKDYKWNTMFRPFVENQTPGFNFQTDKGGGSWDGNSNSLKLNVPAHYTLTFKPFSWTYSLSPYIEKTLDADKYATFSCGNDVEIPTGITVYSATKTNSSSIHLNEESISALSAGNGVLIYGNAGPYQFTPATSTATGVTSGNVFAASGNYGADITTSDFILAGTGDALGFYHPSKAGKLGAHKAYIPASFSTGAKISFNFDATAINEVEASQNGGAFYTLQGVRVDNPQRGIFIQNGKKVVLK